MTALIFLCCRKLANWVPSCHWGLQTDSAVQAIVEAGHPVVQRRSFGMSHTSAYVLVLLLTSCVTQGKTPALSEARFLTCKIWVLTIFTS